MTKTQQRTIIYSIDRHDILTTIGDGWSEFADENDGVDVLYPDSVIGKSLWDFVKGHSLRQIYQEIVRDVRGNDRSVGFDYRCDSPYLKRFMRMEIMGQAQSTNVTFLSHTIRIEAKEHILRVAAAHRGHFQMTRCSICNFVKLPNEQWGELEVALTDFGLLANDREVRFAWGVCPTCRTLNHCHH